MILAISDAIGTAIVSGVVTLGLAVLGGLIKWKLDGIQKTGEDVHILSNSNFGVQLQLNAVVSRRLSAFTKDPADLAAAMLAEKLYNEHMAKQAVVDSTQ